MEKRHTVVLLHGFMQGACDMDAIAQALSPRYRVIAPSLAPCDERHATLAALAQSVHECIRERTEPGERVAMVGYSLGGRVALAYARDYADTLSALVLESAGLGPEGEKQRAQFAQSAQRLADRIDSSPSTAAFVDYWETLPLFAGQQAANPQAFAEQRQSRLAHSLQELSLVTRCAGAHTMPDASSTRMFLDALALGKIAPPARPVLYLAGLRDAKYRAYADSLDGCAVEVSLFDCGHNVHLENPAAFNACVSRFLSQAAWQGASV